MKNYLTTVPNGSLLKGLLIVTFVNIINSCFSLSHLKASIFPVKLFNLNHIISEPSQIFSHLYIPPCKATPALKMITEKTITQISKTNCFFPIINRSDSIRLFDCAGSDYDRIHWYKGLDSPHKSNYLLRYSWSLIGNIRLHIFHHFDNARRRIQRVRQKLTEWREEVREVVFSYMPPPKALSPFLLEMSMVLRKY